MLHIITENNELKNRRFPIPKNVRKLLQQTLDNYKGDKTIDGYKRLNNVLSMDSIAYNEMKRIKNFFDNYGGTDKSAEYILNGGDAMKTWVNNTLYTATKAVKDYKQAKKDAGLSNAFIRHHSKDRQIKKKNKPTVAKFDTKNTNRKMLDGNTLKYESVGKKTIIITPKQQKMLTEAMDDTFSFDELSNLRSFNARYKYCMQHFGGNVGKGSSRAVFQIDDERVLKLAWNEKGVAQNSEEARAYGDDIFPQVFDSDINDLWVVSEYVLPAEAQDFRKCFNMTFNDFISFIYACGAYRFNRPNLKYWAMPYEKWIELLETNEDLCEFDDYIGNYGYIVVGDMTRMCNYGLTKRNGEPHIVLLDSGLTEDVWNNYYKRR